MSQPIDISNLDPSVSPRDDFYHYANGGWLENNPIPDEFSRYGTFDMLREENRKIVHSIIEEVSNEVNQKPGHLAELVGALYRAGMDLDRRNKDGIDPLLPLFSRVDDLDSPREVSELLIDLYAYSMPTLFYIYPSPDRENSEMIISNLHQGGMGLPDVDYYRNTDQRSSEIRERYSVYIKQMFKLAGINYSDGIDFAEIILELETRLAHAGMTRLEQRDPHLTFNKQTLKDLALSSPQFNWEKLFISLKLDPEDQVNVGQPKFINELSTMVTDIPPEQWRIYFKWRILNSSANYLNETLEEEKFKFYGQYLSGKETMQPLWKRVTASTEDALGEAIGKLFVQKYFPPEARERMLDLIENLRVALREKINTLPWMSEKTRKEALEKLERMRVKVGYPDKWRSFENLQLRSDNFYGKFMEASVFNMNFELNKIGKPVDKDEWHMTPQTVNAYYHPLLNEIVFPAGILQPPFFFKDADDAVNYGAIGVVIGHEMTHGFDDQGRKFDKHGNLNDWWTEEDAKAFNERAKLLEEQFNNIQIVDSVYADGKLSLGENIADLGGVNIAYSALEKAWQKAKPEMSENGFTSAQRFFLSYAHIWANNIREKEMIRMTKEDVHSLGINRVNGPLPNSESFIKAFEVKPGDGMYLDKEARASIW